MKIYLCLIISLSACVLSVMPRDMLVFTDTTGQGFDAYGRPLRRRPNVGVVGVGAQLASPRNGPSASLCHRRKPVYTEGHRRRKKAVGAGQS